MLQVIFKCAACKVALTNPLREIEYKSQLSQEYEEAHIPLGFYTTEDGSYYSRAKGQYIVNLKDLINTKHHPDSKRLIGCCGPDGSFVNIICISGHELGTEHSDCWMAHAITFAPAAVYLDRTWVETS